MHSTSAPNANRVFRSYWQCLTLPAQKGGKGGELVEGDGFGADLEGQACSGEGFFQRGCGPILFQELEHHFAPLGEGAFDDFMKIAAQGFRQERLGAAHEHDAGGVHIRLREETAGGNFKGLAWLEIELNEEREQAVVVIAGLGHESAGDFQLQRGDEALRGSRAGGEFNEDGRGDGIWEVGDKFPLAPIALLAPEIFEGVVVEELEIWFIGKARFQQVDEAGVFFDGENFSGLIDEQFGERAEAGADFEDFVGLGQFGGVDDAAELIAVVEKILAEGFGELNPFASEEFPHFREFHARTFARAARAWVS